MPRQEGPGLLLHRVREDFTYVCASFESEEGLFCFPGCNDPDDEAGECPPGYGCRSTGGGADNRKICFPEG